VVGSGEEWKKYHEQFNSIVAEATREDSLPRRGSLHHFLRRLDDSGTPVADHNGALWIELSDGGESSPVGLSASNIFSSSSDRKLADQLLLASIGQVLKSPKHSSETMVEFKNDWNLLRSVSLYSAEYRAEYRARNGATGGANRGLPGAGHALILLTRR